LEVVIKDYILDNGVTYFLIEVRMLAQIWVLKRRYSDFDKMHKRLLNDLEYRAADNMPELPPKRLFFSKEQEFVRERLRLLNKYLKFIVLIFEAIESPILQRFLEIDTRFDPGYEYASVLVAPEAARSVSDCSSLFIEMDKYMKTRFRHVLKNQTDKGTRSTQEVLKALQANEKEI